MSQDDIKEKLEKVKEVLLRNKQLTDEDLEDVFAGLGGKQSAYLNGMRKKPRLSWKN